MGGDVRCVTSDAQSNNMVTVQKMKESVPENKSNNSVDEVLDK